MDEWPDSAPSERKKNILVRILTTPLIKQKRSRINFGLRMLDIAEVLVFMYYTLLFAGIGIYFILQYAKMEEIHVHVATMRAVADSMGKNEAKLVRDAANAIESSLADMTTAGAFVCDYGKWFTLAATTIFPCFVFMLAKRWMLKRYPELREYRK